MVNRKEYNMTDLAKIKTDEEIKSSKPFYRQPWVIIGAVIILLIPLLIIAIRSAKPKRKKLK